MEKELAALKEENQILYQGNVSRDQYINELETKLRESQLTIRRMEQENDELKYRIREMDLEIQQRTQRSQEVCAPAIFDNSHVLEEMLESLNILKEENQELKSDLNKKIINNWTQENEKTVKKWQLDIEKTSFVYGEVLLNTTFKMNLILFTTLIINTLNSLLAALTVTLAFLNIKWVGISFEIVILISSGLATVLGGILKILKIDDRVQDLSKFVEKLDSAWFMFEVQMNVSSDQRGDAKDFIKRADSQYMSLMQQCPPINTKEYIKADHKYKERLFDNYIWTKKFHKQMQEQNNNI